MPFSKNFRPSIQNSRKPKLCANSSSRPGALGLQLERVEVGLAEVPEPGVFPFPCERQRLGFFFAFNLAVAWNCFTSWPVADRSSLATNSAGSAATTPVTSTSSFNSFLRVDVCTKTSLIVGASGAAGKDHVADQSPGLQGRRASDHASRVQEHLGGAFRGRDHLDPEHGVLARLHGLGDIHFAGRPGDAAALGAIDVNDRVGAYPLQ